MVLFDLCALANPPQLNQRVADVILVLGGNDMSVIFGSDDAERATRELRAAASGAAVL